MKKIIKKIPWLYKSLLFFYTKIKTVYHKFLYTYGNRKKVVSKYYKKRMGFYPNLENPQRFTEKLTWLKVFWRDPLAVKCVDKYRVREVVEERIGKEYLNELYGVYDSVEEIDWDKLPNQFIMKVNNGRGHHIISTDKSKLDKEKAIKTLKEGMKIKYHLYSYEWTYEGIEPKIICEKLLSENGGFPIDYKIFCSDGIPKFLFTTRGRGESERMDFFDLNFNRIPVVRTYPNTEDVNNIKKPKNFEKMLELASKLSQGFPQVRVDFYNIDGKIIFGELTFFSAGGVGSFKPDSYDFIFGAMLDFPLSKYNNVK